MGIGAHEKVREIKKRFREKHPDASKPKSVSRVVSRGGTSTSSKGFTREATKEDMDTSRPQPKPSPLSPGEYRQQLSEQASGYGKKSSEYSGIGEKIKQQQLLFGRVETKEYDVTVSIRDVSGIKFFQSHGWKGTRKDDEVVFTGVTGAYVHKFYGMKSGEFITAAKESAIAEGETWGEYSKTHEWHPETKITKTSEGYDISFPYAGAEKYKTRKRQLESAGFGGLLATSFTPEDPLGITSAYYTATGQHQKAIDTKIKSMEGVKSRSFSEFYVSSPMGVIGISAITAGGIGIGIGAVSAASPTVGVMAKIGMGSTFTALAAKEVTPVVVQGVKTGDYGGVTRIGATMGLGIASGYAGFKSGYRFGFGRTEAWLYGKHTFKPGSPEAIRFKSALKISRKLEVVKSHKMDPLDISKDIMRMTPSAAEKTISWLSKHPESVIGGSAASKTQIIGSRTPRDIDLLVKPKKLGMAKRFFGKEMKTSYGEHRIDIHTFEIGGKAGKYHRFGFMTKKPVKGHILGGKKLKVGKIPSEEYGQIWGRTWTHSKHIELDPRLLPKYAKTMTKYQWHKIAKPMGKITLKHEMVHQRYPHMPERIVLAMERKGFVPEIGKAASKYYDTGTARLPMKVRYIKAGEQLFRKGIGGTTKETKYRWFKDAPDFVTHSKSLIISTKKSWSPLSRLRGISAQKYLRTFEHPETHPSYGKTGGFGQKLVTKLTVKPPAPKRVILLSDTGIGKSGYVYPSSYYPSYSIGGLLGAGYYKGTVKEPSYSKTTLSYKPSTPIKFDSTGYTPSKPKKNISYVKPLSYKPPKPTGYPNSGYKPSKTTYPPTMGYPSSGYKPSKYKEPTIRIPTRSTGLKIDYELKPPKRKKMPKDFFDKDYSFRIFKIKSPFVTLKSIKGLKL